MLAYNYTVDVKFIFQVMTKQKLKQNPVKSKNNLENEKNKDIINNFEKVLNEHFSKKIFNKSDDSSKKKMDTKNINSTKENKNIINSIEIQINKNSKDFFLQDVLDFHLETKIENEHNNHLKFIMFQKAIEYGALNEFFDIIGSESFLEYAKIYINYTPPFNYSESLKTLINNINNLKYRSVMDLVKICDKKSNNLEVEEPIHTILHQIGIDIDKYDSSSDTEKEFIFLEY